MLCRQHLPFTSPWRQKAPAKSTSLTPQLQENLMDTKQPAHTRSHTDQYLPYDSHHLQSVKPNIVKCLYECAKHLVTKPSTISKEKKHLLSVLISIGYPSSFMQSQGNKNQETNCPPSSDPQQSCPMSKASPDNFAAIYNNKAYRLQQKQRAPKVRPKTRKQNPRMKITLFCLLNTILSWFLTSNIQLQCYFFFLIAAKHAIKHCIQIQRP